MSFELRGKVAEKIDVEVCSYRRLSEVQMLRDLDLDLRWDQARINIHSTYRTSGVPNHMTVASRSTEIRTFECREKSTVGQV